VPTFDNVTILRASPLRVWSGLTDFAGHSQWKPFVQLSGAAVCGGEATYTFRVDSLDKSMTAKADITCVHKPLRPLKKACAKSAWRMAGDAGHRGYAAYQAVAACRASN
jgi:hypothetical protein